MPVIWDFSFLERPGQGYAGATVQAADHSGRGDYHLPAPAVPHQEQQD